MRNSSPPCERGEGRKAAGGFRAAEDSGPYKGMPVGADVPIRPPGAYAPTVSPSNSLPCQREVARAQPVTEGFRPPESCPENGIPQSASLPAPFHKGA